MTNTQTVVLRQNWKGTPRQAWVLTSDLNKMKAASSAGRTIDIPGTREQDWPSPPLGETALSNPSASGRTMDIPGTPRRDDTAPPPAGESTSQDKGS